MRQRVDDRSRADQAAREVGLVIGTSSMRQIFATAVAMFTAGRRSLSRITGGAPIGDHVAMAPGAAAEQIGQVVDAGPKDAAIEPREGSSPS